MMVDSLVGRKRIVIRCYDNNFVFRDDLGVDRKVFQVALHDAHFDPAFPEIVDYLLGIR